MVWVFSSGEIVDGVAEGRGTARPVGTTGLAWGMTGTRF
jgi:hypothetical protein